MTMYKSTRIPLAMLAVALLGTPASPGDSLETLKKAAIAEIEAADTEILFKKLELAKKYTGALETLEKKLAAEGNLDAIMHLREEKEEVGKSGGTTHHDDKPLVELREKYIAALGQIEKELTAARTRAGTKISAWLREEEAAMVKAGKVNEAVTLRQEGRLLLLELGGEAASEVEIADDPRSTASTSLRPLEPIEIPNQNPPPVDNFFSKDKWFESLTVPVTRQRIRQRIEIGDRGKKSWPTIVISPRSEWVGTGESRILLSGGDVIASQGKFRGMSFGADHGTKYYITDSELDDCVMNKGGVWYGGEQHGKFYLGNCLIRKRFSDKPIDVIDNGFRVESCVLENIEMPRMNFRDKQPADYLNHKWLRFVNCRFVNCRIPSSFLLLTRDCVFEKCIFLDADRHSGEAEITKPVEIVLYVNDCKSRISKLPAAVTLTEKPADELKGVTIPTADSLLLRIDR